MILNNYAAQWSLYCASYSGMATDGAFLYIK